MGDTKSYTGSAVEKNGAAVRVYDRSGNMGHLAFTRQNRSEGLAPALRREWILRKRVATWKNTPDAK